MNAIPPLNLVFMGSAEFAVPALDALIAAGHRIRAVYAQPPRPAGRGHRERPCPVHARAVERGLPVRTPATLKSHQEQQAFAEFDADAAIVAAYGLLLPWPVLTAPRLGCLNIHASLLPRWRGAAPIQRAIEAGDAETGITIMQMDEGLDTGAILARRSIPIPPDATGRTLHDALAAIGAETIVETLAAVAAGCLSATPQPHDGITYAAKIDRDQGRLDWRESADALARRVRAFDPWPGTWFMASNERIKVLAATVERDQGTPGTVLDDALLVACGDGALRLGRLQRPGRGDVDAAAFLRGYPIAKGTVLA